jgi:hypothetical protein
MLFSNVFANQNLRRSISPPAAALCSLHLCDGDEKSVNATFLIPVIYKCPLPQPLSFDILTNARGCGGPGYLTPCILPALLTLSRKKCICKSPVFFTLRTLPSSVSCNPCICHSCENCRVYTNNSHSGTPTSPLPRVTSHKSPVTPLGLPRIMSALIQGDDSL